MSLNLSDTQPNQKNESARGTKPTKAARRKMQSSPADLNTPNRRGLLRRLLRAPLMIALLSVLLALFLVTAASGAAGWTDGRAGLNATSTIEAAIYMIEQYNLALADIDAGRYGLAKERLEFIYAQDPGFLDVEQRWVQVALILNGTPQPTGSELLVTSSPTPTPTLDPRPKEELFAAAQAHFSARDWTATIDTLLALRKADPNFHTADVDGMLYASLRNRGVQNIIELGLFEPGLYDFSLAEAFGPLDGQAANYREWARLYLWGNAFWLAYPEDAVYYYGQLVSLAPELRDASGISAFYRYQQSLIQWAEKLALAGDWCGASAQYQNAQAARPDAELEAKLAQALQSCAALTVIPSDTATWTPIPVFTSAPTFTGPPPTNTDTPAATSVPSDTPVPDTNTPVPTTEIPSDTPPPSNTPEPTATTP